MREPKMAVGLLVGVGLPLGMVVFVTEPPDANAEPRGGGLPRLEFEAPPSLPSQTVPEQPQPVVAPGTPRGVMGYRLPLVSRQEVPAQVVSGVLIPAHTTYVILRPGYWELVGPTPVEVEAVPVAADAEAGRPPTQVKPGWRGWNIWRLFGRSGEK
ncbi:MAG: hypothetical protein OXP66_01965 [Candidatus Tectomicrobia bacterium]|nr:hypothetical protein [Candidatus Tectomicrobia bacterium]